MYFIVYWDVKFVRLIGKVFKVLFFIKIRVNENLFYEDKLFRIMIVEIIGL